MRLLGLSIAGACLAYALISAAPAQAGDGLFHRRASGEGMPWHGYYYEAAWGMPLALVVPPSCKLESHYGWSVGDTRVTRVAAQFSPYGPGEAVYDAHYFRPAPPIPSSTDQLGDYSVRGPNYHRRR